MKPAYIVFCLAAVAARAQPAEAPARFEVASVKSSPPADSTTLWSQSGPGPSGYSATNTTLRTMLRQAFSVKDYQLQCPGWMDTERYDVKAKAPEGTSAKQVWVMLQNLLVERFRIILHREQRDAMVYTLSVGKNGHKMKESASGPDPPPAADAAVAPPMTPPRFTGPPPKDKDGFPIVPGGSPMSWTSSEGLVKLTASGQTMSGLIRMLTDQLGRDVIDQTGLTGKYDFRLEFSGNAGNGIMPPLPMRPGAAPVSNDLPDPAGPTIFRALQDQLGLKLEPGKAPREVIVIDKAEKTPLEN